MCLPVTKETRRTKKKKHLKSKFFFSFLTHFDTLWHGRVSHMLFFMSYYSWMLDTDFTPPPYMLRS